jgi:predicted nucleotidyltransferase
MSSMAKAISIDQTGLAALCRRHHIRRLSLFGSVLRPDFRPDSDVDVLVEFEPGQVPGFLALHEIETELSQLLDERKVDLVTQRSLNRRVRDRVLSSAEVEYAAG